MPKIEAEGREQRCGSWEGGSAPALGGGAVSSPGLKRIFGHGNALSNSGCENLLPTAECAREIIINVDRSIHNAVIDLTETWRLSLSDL